MGKTLPMIWRISKINQDMSHELGSFESFEQQKHLVNRWLKASLLDTDEICHCDSSTFHTQTPFFMYLRTPAKISVACPKNVKDTGDFVVGG